jgi:hypothetical protein
MGAALILAKARGDASRNLACSILLGEIKTRGAFARLAGRRSYERRDEALIIGG